MPARDKIEGGLARRNGSEGGSKTEHMVSRNL